jgi:hypothetical protein
MIAEIHQTEWQTIADESRYTLQAISKQTGVAWGSLKKYLCCETVPREKNRQRVNMAMNRLKEEKKIPFHPSYGYATPEQVKKLEAMGFSPERDLLMKQIQKQNALKGKVE